MELNSNFQRVEGEGGGESNQKPFMGLRVMDIFWNNAVKFSRYILQFAQSFAHE